MLWAVVLFFVSVILSTLIIRLGIPRLNDGSAPVDDAQFSEKDKGHAPPLPESSSTNVFDFKSTGFWIGFCETFLIFVLVYANAFSALAIIIGAKQFVRSEKIQERPSYYLLGTLANLAVASLFALLASQNWPLPSTIADAGL